ncbi:hypothetical protein INT47_010442 [Mucor saturninus]|uniref:Tc1-like transposase DDE domain-containing protein n=1 Tax=Mucor saturninus TaxID=64648 RepID=A0A8H7RD05_9FUNG|nr:hypothetical protein INT47_010442 [Mucor saturninus]
MDVDDDSYPLADTVDFDNYMDFKPPEKPKPTPKAPKNRSSPSTEPAAYYKKHADDVKGHFFHLVYEEGLNAEKAAKQLGVARRTAYNWLKKDQDQIFKTAEPLDYKIHLEEKFIDHPSATLDQAMESITSQFSDLKVTKTTVYNFMTGKCALSFKKAHFHSKERNSSINIEKKFGWEVRAEVIPLTRAKTTTTVGAISPYGVVNIKIRVPYSMVSKKRKTAGGSKMQETIGTVTGHYLILSPVQLIKFIESRGYGCVYLPPYSPDLNPIEQFWSVVKSKLKREKLLEAETPKHVTMVY